MSSRLISKTNQFNPLYVHKKNKKLKIAMKLTLQTISLLSLLAFSLLSSSCEKRFLDYRNKYTGNFDIVYTSTWSNMGNSGSSTTNLDGRVYYDKEVRQMIRIEYNNTYVNLDISRDGILSQNGAIVGKFDGKNKFNFTFSSYSPGGGGTQTYVGTRKK